MDNIKQWFVERKTIYFIFALFYNGNINKGLEILRENDLLLSFANYKDNDLLSSVSEKIIKEINENQNNNNYKDLVLEDYQRLFVGPDEILAPLWESVYKTKDKLLFGDVELEVREFYNSVCLDVKQSESADCFYLELLFMSHLCDIGKKDNNESIKEKLLKQREFLKEHLLSWISSWAEDVHKNAEIQFWANFAQLTIGWLENDLEEIVNVMNSCYIKNL